MTDRGLTEASGPLAAAPFPAIEDLLPHGLDAVLLDAVLAHDAKTTVCRVDPARSALYLDADGRVPAYVGLEYMAQAVAAHGGLLDREQGRDARPGLFLGTRRLHLSTSQFATDQPLEVVATHARGSGPLLAFDCSIRPAGQGELAKAMVSATLTVYLLDSFEALHRDFTDLPAGSPPQRGPTPSAGEDGGPQAASAGPTN